MRPENCRSVALFGESRKRPFDFLAVVDEENVLLHSLIEKQSEHR
jgi:hypothetical protein